MEQNGGFGLDLSPDESMNKLLNTYLLGIHIKKEMILINKIRFDFFRGDQGRKVESENILMFYALPQEI